MNLPTSINDFPPLQAGDILLYGEHTLLSWAIRFRTWSDVSHVEIYSDVAGRSLASRSSGPGLFPVRMDGLRRVIRPVAPFDFAKGRAWFEAIADHLPYGYTDLLRFYLVNVPTKGLICSEFADLFFRECGLPLFNLDYPEGAVCPRDYELLSPLLAKEIWTWKPAPPASPLAAELDHA